MNVKKNATKYLLIAMLLIPTIAYAGYGWGVDDRALENRLLKRIYALEKRVLILENRE